MTQQDPSQRDAAGYGPSVGPVTDGPTGTKAVQQVFEQTLDYSRRREYRGYDYSDGMSSPFRRLLPVDNRWVNIAFQETAKRAPVNVRPLLLIPERRSFKGSALFALGNLVAYERTDDERYLDEAADLVDWLLDNRRDDPFGWGHNHDIQTLDGTIERNTPSVVTVTYATLAILRLARHRDTEGYALVRDRVPEFIVDDLGYSSCESGARINYRATKTDDVYIVNANALGARTLLELHAAFGDSELRERAESILDYVVSRQTDAGGWMYADPPSASHLSMDNHHNGFVLESLLRHRAITGSSRYDSHLEDGMRFYRETLHEPDGAPNWDETARYPRDIHAAAESVVAFSEAGDHEFARRVLGWTLDTLYAGDGRFYYQKRRWYTKRFTLMRWCQAWMTYAMATYLDHVEELS